MIVEANYNKFTGIYENNNTANRVYKYRFIIRDSNNIVFDDSDWRIHDSSNDIIENGILTSKDFYITNKIYDPIVSNYIVEYQIELMKPVDGIKIFSSETNISITTEYPSNLRTSLKLEYDRENAYINISMNDAEWNQLGYFKLLRADSTNGYTTWTPIKKFAITNTRQFVYQDKTIQQGVGYTYAYQEYGVSGNKNLCESRGFLNM